MRLRSGNKDQRRVAIGARAIARMYVVNAVVIPQVIEEVCVVTGGVTAVQVFRVHQCVVLPRRHRFARTSVYICVQLGWVSVLLV